MQCLQMDGSGNSANRRVPNALLRAGQGSDPPLLLLGNVLTVEAISRPGRPLELAEDGVGRLPVVDFAAAKMPLHACLSAPRCEARRRAAASRCVTRT